MRKLLILLLASLSACASPYGNYVRISDLYNEKMADDAAHELDVLYPPASTHFTVSQDTKDAFGTELLKKLRESGFAIEQSQGISAIFASSDTTPSVTPAKSNPTTPNAPATSASPTTTPVAAKPFGYIVDQVADNLFRVTITIESTVVSRVYMGSAAGIVPAGSWTRKEG